MAAGVYSEKSLFSPFKVIKLRDICPYVDLKTSKTKQKTDSQMQWTKLGGYQEG